jgi:glycylpeptide N-tetradecanoyltransferase
MSPSERSKPTGEDISNDPDNEEELSGSEDEALEEPIQSVGSSSAPAQSSKKKKKKKSKVSKALNALKGKQRIPDEIVNEVMDRVKAEGSVPSEEVTAENIREVLEQLKIMDVVQGKAGLGGLNKTDMGEHKVSYHC